MRFKLLFAMLFTVSAVMADQVVFDPATYDPADLPAGATIVDIGGTMYAQIVLDGWNSLIDVDDVIVDGGSSIFSMDAKYAVGPDNGGFTIDQINTFLKLANFRTSTEIGAAGAASSSDFTHYEVAIATEDTVTGVQVAGQETTSWGAVAGDTLWIGRVVIEKNVPYDEYVVFDPSNLSGVILPDGMEIVNIGDVDYCQIVLNGWGSSIAVPEMVVPELATDFTMQAKYAVGPDNGGYTIDQINTFLKLANSDFSVEIGAAGAASSADFIDYTVPIAAWDVIGNVQVAGQQTVSWGAVAGDTLWIGKVSLIVDEYLTTSDFSIANVVVGAVDSPEDLTADVHISWDADSLYMVFTVVDDSIVNTGASYQCDNIEVYFDMDNSKNIHYPRNGSWVANPDPSYDANDWQARLVPGVDYSVNNTARPSPTSGARQVYEETADGYTFIFNIAIDSLIEGFDPKIDTTLIGFDVLLSDNDDAAAVNDANRNQLTLNSPTDKPYNDCSLFATFRLAADGMFTVIPDEEAPAAPGNLAGSSEINSGRASLTWDEAVDNIAVMSYNVYNGTTLVKSVYGTEGTVSTNVNDLAAGDYTFRVEAVDNYGLVSPRSSVDVTVEIEVGVEPTTADQLRLYPNPANSVLTLSGVQDVLEIQVISITGSVIMTVHNTNSVNVADLNEGIYLIKIRTTENVYSATFVKE